MHKYTILIVEDEEISRVSLTRILELEGYNVRATSTGAEALAALQNHSVDLMILDLNLPDISGMEILSKVVEMTPSIRVIILTAHGSMESVIDALRKRVRDYLLKPATAEQIIESVRRVFTEEQISRRNHGVVEPGSSGNPSQDKVYTLPNQVTINIRKHIIQWENNSIVLTPTETRFLGVLLEQFNQVVPHSEIVNRMYGYLVNEEEAAAVLRPIVSRLRKKIDAAPGGNHWIKTVRSSGYSFQAYSKTA
jgi:DNA-binding response OmpR family regulator